MFSRRFTVFSIISILAKDDAWTPKVKVRGTVEKIERVARSKKVAAVEAGLKQAAEKRRKIKTTINKKLIKDLIPPPTSSLEEANDDDMTSSSVTSGPGGLTGSRILQPTKSSLLMNTPTSSSTLEAVKLSLSRSESANTSLSNKKPKKGQSTAKQRLGKILKLKF